MLSLTIPPFLINTTSEKQPGFEILILKEASKRLNFTTEYISNPYKVWGTKLPNGSVTDMFSMVASRKANLMIGMVIVNYEFINDFDIIVAHVQLYVTFHVPRALSVEPWQNLTLSFTKTIWILILGSIISTSLTLWLTGRDENLLNWIFVTLHTFLSSYSFIPKPFLVCMILVIWNLYSFVVNTIYQSGLTSFLTKSAYQHQIATVEEMVNSDLDYGGYQK